jgi:uncharacterized iron-regulated membrane protein
MGGLSMASARTRKTFLKIHLYVALAAGVSLGLLGLTGAGLVFDRSIDRALAPALWVVRPEGERVPLSAIVERARAARPGKTVAGVRLPEAPDDAAVVTVGAGLAVHVDPYRGAVLGERRPRETFVGLLNQVHTSLAAGPIGKVVVALSTALLLVDVVTGLYLWWPARGRLRQALSIRLRAGLRRAIFDSHGVAGAVTALPLLAIAATGLGLAYPDVAARLSPGEALARPPRSGPGAGGADLDAALARALSALPGASPVLVAMPTQADDPITITARFPGDRSAGGRSAVHLDRTTGAVLRVDDGRVAPGPDRLHHVVDGLHTGSIAGKPTEAVALLSSLSLVLQVVTGFVLWWKPKRRAANA